ncbi:putative minor tail protein [Serinibacter arcticus]|uniref:Putative minor tail protein n=1 Tax=Serinibacter arcticus TaxID=1655435 RepID=A0A4Z1E5R4_9MICO|nr:putative minor tail protein [Serinibacter arcticus]
MDHHRERLLAGDPLGAARARGVPVRVGHQVAPGVGGVGGHPDLVRRRGTAGRVVLVVPAHGRAGARVEVRGLARVGLEARGVDRDGRAGGRLHERRGATDVIGGCGHLVRAVVHVLVRVRTHHGVGGAEDVAVDGGTLGLAATGREAGDVLEALGGEGLAVLGTVVLHGVELDADLLRLGQDGLQRNVTLTEVDEGRTVGGTEVDRVLDVEQLDAVAVLLQQRHDVDARVRGPGDVELERDVLRLGPLDEQLPRGQLLLGVVPGRVGGRELAAVVVAEELADPGLDRPCPETVHRLGGREGLGQGADARLGEPAGPDPALSEGLDVRERVVEGVLVGVVVRREDAQTQTVGQRPEVLGGVRLEVRAVRLDVLVADLRETLEHRLEADVLGPRTERVHAHRDLLDGDVDGLGLGGDHLGHTRTVEVQRVELQTGGTGHVERAGAGREGDGLAVGAGEVGVAPGVTGDRRGGEGLGVGRVETELDRARTLSACGDALDAREVDRRVGEVPTLGEDDLRPGVGGAVALTLTVLDDVRVLGLLVEHVQDGRERGGGGVDALRATVGVGGHHDAVQLLGVTVLDGVGRGVVHALALARLRHERVRVRVVPETEDPAHAVAHDLVAVLRVGRGVPVRHVVAPREESAVGGVLEREHGRLVAHGHGDRGRRGLALRVGDAQRRDERADLVERVLGGDTLGVELAVAVEVPLVGELLALGVGGAGAVEGDGHGCLAGRRRVRRRDRDRRLVLRRELDAVQARLRVLREEALAVVEHVHRPVRADLHVDRT